MKNAFLISLYLFRCCCIHAQCVNSFPYVEDFEISQGGWTSGGTSSDWTWGTPSKVVIDAAGSGNKCWTIGGLTTSFYYYGERSFVESPCFDFTNLQHPYISLKIFWESERTYDGSNFQYSSDNGTTWTNVGSISDPRDCLNDNWYNSPNIVNLNSLAVTKEGWSGSIQPTSGSCQGGNGSSEWKVAKHCVPYLAGVPNVIFRMTFGAGTTCNFYDGIAFDSISISEAPANTTDFNFSCATDTFLFQSITTLCPETFSWNFGDAGSGVNNFANTINSTHLFAAPGNYTVTLSTGSSCNAPNTITKQVEVISASALSIPVSCPSGNDGKAYVHLIIGNPPFTYLWNTIPAQTTDTAFNLTSGNYTATITGANTCPVVVDIMVDEPAAFNHLTTMQPDSCNLGTGFLQVDETGGTSPYQFVWSNGTTGTNLITNLIAGGYTVTVTDSNGCIDSVQAAVSNISGMTVNIFSQTDVSCWGEADGSAAISITGGTSPYSYLWSPSGGSSNIIINVSAGIYNVQITDATNCSTSASVNILQPLPLSVGTIATDASCGNLNGSISLYVSGGVSPYNYHWNNGQSSSAILNLDAGVYSYSITDRNGCMYEDSSLILQTLPVSLNVSFSDTIVDERSAITLTTNAAGGNGVYSYQWFPTDFLSNANSFAPVCTPFSDILYSVSVSSGFCMDTGFIRVQVNRTPKDVYIPNVFSPNGDGNNDYFEIYGDLNAIAFLELQIFNRWGEKIFESSNPYFKWDGTYKSEVQNPQVFTWKLKLAWMYGANEEMRKGSLTLIR